MTIKAKYPGQCKTCGGHINVGEEIEWSREKGARHIECPKQKEHDGPTYTLHGGSGYGCRGWTKGQVVRSSERQREQGWPEYVTVINSSAKRVYEDGMSFGVGDEEGYLYRATCHAATEEAANLKRAQHTAIQRKESAAKRLAEIEDKIARDGEHPDGDHSVDGEILRDNFTIYGGGSRLVIADEWIWYVQNNGMDGDNWAHNNVKTGGAGAIGHRILATDDMVKELRSLVKEAA